MTDLQGAIDAINPNSTDEEWTRLLAEAMNAADELSALRERVAALEGALRDIFDHFDTRNQSRQAPGHGHETPGIWDSDNAPGIAGTECDWCAKWKAARAILSKQEPEYSGWVEVVDEGESGNAGLR